MAFSQKTLDFLETNFSNNSREWYKEHKKDYQEYVAEPFSSFITALTPTIHKIDDRILIDPRRISRLHRDMRFAAGGPIFRDNVWCAFMREQDLHTELPGFYFDLSPRGIEYGFGFYNAPAKTMDALREMILDGNRIYLEARKAYESQNIFTMGGDRFKKPRYQDAPAADIDWLNMRSMYFFAREDVSDAIFQEDLAAKVAEAYLVLEPIYRLFTRVIED